VNISTTSTPKAGLLDGWLHKPDLKLLNLLYDLTPSKYITTVITEVGMIPCTSVPVVRIFLMLLCDIFIFLLKKDLSILKILREYKQV
jgi:hypothetical protein